MTFDIHCIWADNCASHEDLADVWGEVSLEIKDFFKETLNENKK